jgi:hypothetical protein
MIYKLSWLNSEGRKTVRFVPSYSDGVELMRYMDVTLAECGARAMQWCLDEPECVIFPDAPDDACHYLNDLLRGQT